MRRAIIAGSILALFAIAGAGTLLLLSTRRKAPAVTASASKPPLTRPAVKEPPLPPLEGRVLLTTDQSNEALAAGLIDRPVRSLLKVSAPMSYGEFQWNDKGVPPGPSWVRVDLASQILSVFRSGHEIGTAVILYGADGLPTPTGKFPILAKLKDHRSATYGNAPMPYTLRLTNDGVAIHGSNVRWGFATHGCVGVPKAFAAKLFEVLSKGDEVMIVGAKKEPAA
ncbi:MAG: L,D-transpeptidase family protein [Sphingomicrobium sp.]